MLREKLLDLIEFLELEYDIEEDGRIFVEIPHNYHLYTLESWYETIMDILEQHKEIGEWYYDDEYGW